MTKVQYQQDSKEKGVAGGKGETSTARAVKKAAASKKLKLAALARRCKAAGIVGKDVAFFASDIHHKSSTEIYWLGRVVKLYQMKKGGQKGSGKTKFLKGEWAVDVQWLEPVDGQPLRYGHTEHARPWLKAARGQ